MKINQYRAAVIGLGRIGMLYDLDNTVQDHTPIIPQTHSSMYDLHGDTRLISVMDADSAKKHLAGTHYPDAQFFTSWDDLKQTAPELVSICTPPSIRFELIKEILNQPSVRVIFCEKPISLNLDEAKQIRQLVKQSDVLFIPNLSRRWNTGIRQLRETLAQQCYGSLQKIHMRYTRGIWNTGSHLFDLIHFLIGKITEVQVYQKIETSSDADGEPSYSFMFQLDNDVTGVAEAFDDRQYYMFEVDFYLSKGKISILLSGDEIVVQGIGKHPLFEGHESLVTLEHTTKLLHESHLMNALTETIEVLLGLALSSCTVDDAIYPMLVAGALIKSFECGGMKVKVAKLDD